MFVGPRVGGRLKYQRRERLDVGWRGPAKIERFELTFGGDPKALKPWWDIKTGSRHTRKKLLGRMKTGQGLGVGIPYSRLPPNSDNGVLHLLPRTDL